MYECIILLSVQNGEVVGRTARQLFVAGALNMRQIIRANSRNIVLLLVEAALQVADVAGELPIRILDLARVRQGVVARAWRQGFV